jgi:hypothetical protein
VKMLQLLLLPPVPFLRPDGPTLTDGSFKRT